MNHPLLEELIQIATNPLLISLLLGFSLLLFAGSLLSLPLLAAAIPEDYFLPREKQKPHHRGRTFLVFRTIAGIVKNLLGIILVAAGIAMLFLPGQGLITIFLGLVFLNFPGKRRLELALISRPSIFRAVNKLRSLRAKGPLLLPDNQDTARINHNHS